MMRLGVLIPLLIWITSSLTYSQSTSSKNFKIALKQLNLTLKNCYEELVVEKKLPFSTDESVLVIPKIATQEEGFLELNALILIINHQTGKIISKYYESNVWTSDALRLASIIIYTAPYRLNATTRAFGVRVQYNGSSRPNPYGEDYLSLFIRDGDKLAKVLSDFSVSSTHGEWDTHCAGEFVSEEKALIMSKNQTNGFYDIIVKNRITDRVNTPKGDDCLEKSTETIKTQILRFGNDGYK